MDERARTESLRPPARLRTVLGWSALVGAGGGLLGFAYLAVLHGFELVLGPDARDPRLHLLLMAAVGAAVGLLAKWLGPPGDIELLVDNVHVLEGDRAQVRHLRSLLPMSLLCIASGGGAGPEAPLVQTTGTGAQWLAERLRVSGIDRRMLTISGMAAAFTVLFGAPIGAALFALEILHRRGLQYHEALLPAVVSSLVGYAVYVAASGLGLTPVWNFELESEPVPLDLVWALGQGAEPDEVWVADVMTEDLVVADPDEPILDVAARMRDEGVRHVTVVENGTIVGVVSARDLLDVMIDYVQAGV